MKSRSLVYLVALALAGGRADARPNIIVLISDDQGYGDLAAHGNPILRTPNLDRLHAESVRLTDFHVAPMCTPTRGQLLSGLDALRNGAMNVSSGRTPLRRDVPTLPELLGRIGYSTGLFGKWHLGDNYPYRPQDRGFQESLWYPSSHLGSVPDAWGNDYFDDVYRRGAEPERTQGYTTDVLFDAAMRWMKTERDAGRTFFTYLATAAPHGPHYVPAKYLRAVRERWNAAGLKLPELGKPETEQLLRFLAMIENFDENVGRLETFLSREALRDETLIVFLTDNGSTMGPKYFNAGMFGGKTTLWEGGHRVPCFWRWPGGKLGAPRDVAELTQVQDILPTLVEFAGASPPQRCDGVSLAPLLRGTAQRLPDRKLVIHYSRMPVNRGKHGVEPTLDGAAVLWRQWRFLENRELYDVRSDPLQRRDVAAEHPEVVAELRAHLTRWWREVEPTVNRPQRIVIGSEHENPVRLTACEWWNVFVDQQAQVRRGERKQGVWHLQADKAGTYEIHLRRWPEDAALPLAAAAPEATLVDGRLPPGQALPIAAARLRIGAVEQQRRVGANDEEALFRVELPAGDLEIEAVFLNQDGKELCGAYYASVKRL